MNVKERQLMVREFMKQMGWEVPLEAWAWRVVEEMCGGGPCLFDDGYHKWSVAIDLLGEVEKVFAWIGSREVIPTRCSSSVVCCRGCSSRARFWTGRSHWSTTVPCWRR